MRAQEPDRSPLSFSPFGVETSTAVRPTALGLLALVLLLSLGLPVCAGQGTGNGKDRGSAQPTAAPLPEGLAEATFAGGCFWCMEPPFDHLEGVVSTTSGYTGGRVDRPSYEQVSMGGTGHLESVRVVYDPERVSYEQLLEVFWHNIDPTDDDGQFCDRGAQYTTAIFVHDADQRRLAETSKAALEASPRFDEPLATVIREAGTFYPAEDYHQDFYEKNPQHYKRYRLGCGRDYRLQQLWGQEAP